jgi:hypothetical protein
MSTTSSISTSDTSSLNSTLSSLTNYFDPQKYIDEYIDELIDIDASNTSASEVDNITINNNNGNTNHNQTIENRIEIPDPRIGTSLLHQTNYHWTILPQNRDYNISPPTRDNTITIRSNTHHRTINGKDKSNTIHPRVAAIEIPDPRIGTSLLHQTNYHWTIAPPNDRENNQLDTDDNTSPMVTDAHEIVIPTAEIQGTTDTEMAVTHQSNLSFLQDEVLQVTSGTSQKFVSSPSKDTVLLDAMLALRRFKITVRRRFEILFASDNESIHKNLPIHSPPTLSTNESITSTSSTPSTNTLLSIDEPALDSLKTGLRPPRKCSETSPASDSVESFLIDLENIILDKAWTYQPSFEPISDTINSLSKKLSENPKAVVVPTDKTNSFRVIDLDTYRSQVKAHLQHHAKPISHKELQEVKQKGLKLLSNLTPHLSWGEYGYIEQSLQSHAVPTPKLLIKDHKPKLPDGSYQPD